MTEQLQSVNRAIYEYWSEIKEQVFRTRLKKKRVGTFTRPNGRRILALKRKSAWRYPNGIRSHNIKKPSIGYKRDKNHRFRRAADGLLFKLVSNVNEVDFSGLKQPCEVFVIRACVSARTRRLMLEKAQSLKLPLYMNRAPR